MKSKTDSYGEATALKRSLPRATGTSEIQSAPRSIGGRLRTLLQLRDEGSALVEMALTLPALLMVLTAICTFGIAFNNELTLTSAVGSGAQYLQLIRTSTSDPCADTLAAIENAAPTLTAANLKLTVSMNGTTPTQTNNSCPGAQSSLVQGQPVTVSATYPCTIVIYGTTFSKACQLSAKVTEYEY